MCSGPSPGLEKDRAPPRLQWRRKLPEEKILEFVCSFLFPFVREIAAVLLHANLISGDYLAAGHERIGPFETHLRVHRKRRRDFLDATVRLLLVDHRRRGKLFAVVNRIADLRTAVADRAVGDKDRARGYQPDGAVLTGRRRTRVDGGHREGHDFTRLNRAGVFDWNLFVVSFDSAAQKELDHGTIVRALRVAGADRGQRRARRVHEQAGELRRTLRERYGAANEKQTADDEHHAASDSRVFRHDLFFSSAISGLIR